MKSKIIFLFVIIFFANSTLFGQDFSKTQNIPSPSEERFEPAFGKINDVRKLKERSDSDIVRIFNEDGSIWYEFSYYETSPLFFAKNYNAELKPMRRLPKNNFPFFAIMFRLKAESENWYEVIVNEETQAVKYVSKKDNTLGKADWENYIPRSMITFDKKQNPLRVAPDGEISSVQMPEKQKFFVAGYSQEIKGDWLLVWTGWSKFVETPVSGWIRWRKGNDLLIRFADYSQIKGSAIDEEDN